MRGREAQRRQRVSPTAQAVRRGVSGYRCGIPGSRDALAHGRGHRAERTDRFTALGVCGAAPPPTPGKRPAHSSAGPWAGVQAEGAGSSLGFRALAPEQPRLSHPTWEAGEERSLPDSVTLPTEAPQATRWHHAASNEAVLAAGLGEGVGTGTRLRRSLGLSSRQWWPSTLWL